MSTEDTVARLRILRATHVQEPTPGWQDLPQCALTGDEWPCDEAMLLAELDRLTADRNRVAAELAELRAGLPEWRCPSCGAITRARMGDHQDKEPDRG